MKKDNYINKIIYSKDITQCLEVIFNLRRLFLYFLVEYDDDLDFKEFKTEIYVHG